jgi:hypothetical protein
MDWATFGSLILAGIFISWQGIQAIQGKRQVKTKMFERTLIQSLAPNQQAQTMKILGALVFIGIGIYFLIMILLR